MAKDKAKRLYDKYSAQLEAKRMGGFTATLSILDSLYGNLGTTEKGLARSLTNQNTRTMEALARTNANIAAQSRAAVTGGMNNAVSSYGGLYSGAVAQSFSPANAKSDQVITAGEAANVTAAGLTRAGNEAMKIQQAGVEEAKAAAQYALSQAAIARAQADSDAAMQMQYQLQLQKMQQTGGALSSVYPGLDQVTDFAAQIAAEARSLLSQAAKTAEADGTSINLAAVLTQLQGQMLLSSPQEAALASFILRAIYAQQAWERGPGTRPTIETIVLNAVKQAYAGEIPKKDQPLLESYIADSLGQTYENFAGQPTGGETQTGNWYDTLTNAVGAGALQLTLSGNINSYSLDRMKKEILALKKTDVDPGRIQFLIDAFRTFQGDKAADALQKWYDSLPN